MQKYIWKELVNADQINFELNQILNSKKNSISEEFNLSEIEVLFENSNEENKLINKISDEIKKNGFEKLQ